MSGTHAGQRRRGVPVAEAAKVLGLNYEALRKRIKRGTLPAYKEGERWYVLLDFVPDNVPDSAGTSVPDPHGETVDNIHGFPITPAEVERAIARTGQQYTADLGTMLAELREVFAGQVAAQQETIAAQADTIAELRRRAEVAEVERDALRVQAAPQPLSDAAAPPASEDTPAAPGGAGGFWRRVRRALGGEG